MVGRVFCSSRGCLALLLLLYPFLPRLSTNASPLTGSFAGPRELGARDVMGRKEGGSEGETRRTKWRKAIPSRDKTKRKKEQAPQNPCPSLSISLSEREATNQRGGGGRRGAKVISLSTLFVRLCFFLCFFSAYFFFHFYPVPLCPRCLLFTHPFLSLSLSSSLPKA